MASRTFRSVEFTDLEGDIVIRHEFMTDEEAQGLIKAILDAGGRNVTVNCLQEETPRTPEGGIVVMSGHAERHLLPRS